MCICTYCCIHFQLQSAQAPKFSEKHRSYVIQMNCIIVKTCGCKYNGVAQISVNVSWPKKSLVCKTHSLLSSLIELYKDTESLYLIV
jgi:hypothetical protein